MPINRSTPPKRQQATHGQPGWGAESLRFLLLMDWLSSWARLPWNLCPTQYPGMRRIASALARLCEPSRKTP